MARLKDIVGYLCQNYPYEEELSKARLTKLVYLADWKSCIEYEKQISEIQWVFNHFGPYVDDVSELAYKDEDFNVTMTSNTFGNLKEVISLKKSFPITSLTNDEKGILDFVIKQTHKLRWDEFIQLVYSTYPILTHSRYSNLDLVKTSKRYKNEVEY